MKGEMQIALVSMAKNIIKELKNIVGDENVFDGKEVLDRSSIWGTNQPCVAKAVVSPLNTQELSSILELCNANRQSVVPMGGMTNLVQGAVTSVDDIAVSFEKMNRIEEIDATAHTMTVQAGVTMQEAQAAADQEGLYFPVDIGSRGNCMLGGNVSTNAGGTRVIRYGMIRDSVLGLEAVLADGTIVSSMNSMLKNNSGFDLKQLFIGTEGVLGFITRIVFRMQVKPRSHNVALLACNDYGQVTQLLNKARELLGGALCGFEVMWDNYFHEVVQPIGRLSTPIGPKYRYYIIIETIGTNPKTDDVAFESALTEMFSSELVEDGALAKSDTEREAIWAIRHDVEWIIRDALIFDISLPVADFLEYIEIITDSIKRDLEDAKVITFGHLGDNNLHVSVLCEGARTSHMKTIEQHVYGALEPFGGAVSAEHGIGLEKKPWLGITRSDQEIELMKTLKRSLDPQNILNPGKVISVD
ncbi:MAG: FAD-binding oxidoreductase [Woeseia sp.]|nr:FAD-binding oxidoreductase [Woeseia sp.]|tara:strand:- start:2968 stop:4383 length:1416 start_codon:yes stop_codon:yes gene_type:complete